MTANPHASAPPRDSLAEEEDPGDFSFSRARFCRRTLFRVRGFLKTPRERLINESEEASVAYADAGGRAVNVRNYDDTAKHSNVMSIIKVIKNFLSDGFLDAKHFLSY